MSFFINSALFVAFCFFTTVSSQVLAPTTLRYAFGTWSDFSEKSGLWIENLWEYGSEGSRRRVNWKTWEPNSGVRYSSFIDEYQEDMLNVTATRSTITIMSALSVMAGMFPPGHRIFRALNWQPIPVWHDTEDFDKAFMTLSRETSDFATSICPAYGKLLNQALQKINSPDERPENSELYNFLSSKLGSTVNTLQNLMDIFDTLYLGVRNGLRPPKWATEIQRDYKNQPLYPDVLLPFLTEYFENLQFYQGNEKMMKLFTGPIYHKIGTTFKELQSDPTSPRKMWLHFTHDSTMYTTLEALKLENAVIAEPGDGVIFELHDDNNQKTVRIFLVEGRSRNIEETKTTQCPEPCTLDTFIDSFKPLSPEEWNVLCHS